VCYIDRLGALGFCAGANVRIRSILFSSARVRSDSRRWHARFAAGGLSAVLLSAGVGGCGSAHGPQADGLRPATTNTALMASAGIPTPVASRIPAWSQDPPHRLASHQVQRATQHPPLVRSPTSAVPATSAPRDTATSAPRDAATIAPRHAATSAPRVTERRSTPAASHTGPVHSWSSSQQSRTRSVTSADGTTMTTTTTATTRTVDGKTTRTTRTHTKITPPRAGTHR
jgi:hypothetical protein